MTFGLTAKNIYSRLHGMLSMLIKDGKLADGRVVDIVIKEGKILKIGKDIDAADEVYDAKGLYVLPGAIDIHVHMRSPGNEHKEDWRTGSQAALNGGVTTVLDMPNNKEPIVTRERLLRKLEVAKKDSLLSFRLFYGISPENLDKLGEVKDMVCGYKLFLEHSTGNMGLPKELWGKAFEAVEKTGRILIVHAEDPELNFKYKSIYPGRADPLVHSDSRPNISEASAIKYCLDLAKRHGTRLHITHLSSSEGLLLIRQAKREGVDVTCDTTHSYLFMTRKDLEEKGAFAKMNPPLRNPYDVRALWQGLIDGSIDMISTDHAPHTVEEKAVDFMDAPSGVPHLDLFYPMLLNEVNEGRMFFDRLIELVAINPAGRFGLERKGQIKEGFDADLVVVDMGLEKTVTKKELKTKCGWSPFEGRKLKGWPVKIFLGGKST